MCKKIIFYRKNTRTESELLAREGHLIFMSPLYGINVTGKLNSRNMNDKNNKNFQIATVTSGGN